MKAKTCEQIYQQWQRMTHYATNPTNVNRVKRAATLTSLYWDNIYAANGIYNRFTCDTQRANDIWLSYAAPVSIRTGEFDRYNNEPYKQPTNKTYCIMTPTETSYDYDRARGIARAAANVLSPRYDKELYAVYADALDGNISGCIVTLRRLAATLRDTATKLADVAARYDI